MRNVITISLLIMAISSSVFCQPPNAFKYQAVVRDGDGNIISNQSVTLRISIHNETPVGTILYQEMFSETTNQFGLVSLNIGLGSPVIIGTFNAIDWKNDSKFLEVEIADGADYYSLGISEFYSVPYALFSDRSADGYWGLYNSSVFYNSGNVGIGTSNPLEKLHVADHIRVGEDPTYSTVYGELYHNGGGTGFVINSHAGGGSWADMYFQTNANTRMFIESNGKRGSNSKCLWSE